PATRWRRPTGSSGYAPGTARTRRRLRSGRPCDPSLIPRNGDETKVACSAEQRSAIEDGEVELAEARWIADDVDGDDLSARDGEGQDPEQPSPWREHGSDRARLQRGQREACPATGCSCLLRPRFRAADFRCGAGTRGYRVGPDDDV